MILPFTAPIVGARFRPPAADVLNNLAGDTPLTCVREPDNEHDANAIKVTVDFCLAEPTISLWIEDSDQYETVADFKYFNNIGEDNLYHLGYVPRDKAEMLAPYLDKMGGTCVGKLSFNMEGRPQVEMSVEDGESQS